MKDIDIFTEEMTRKEEISPENLCDLAEKKFADFDLDKNGQLERSELKAIFSVSSAKDAGAKLLLAIYDNFDLVKDLSKDDFLSHEQAISFKDILCLRKAKAKGNQNIELLENFKQKYFDLLDSNNDGTLSKAELTRQPKDQTNQPGFSESRAYIVNNFENIAKSLKSRNSGWFDFDREISKDDINSAIFKENNKHNYAQRVSTYLCDSYQLDGLDLVMLGENASLKSLYAQRKNKERELNKNFGISFSHLGDASIAGGKIYALRSPRLIELSILEQTIQQSLPSVYVGKVGKGLQYNFRQTHSNDYVLAEYFTNLQKIFVNPISANAIIGSKDIPSSLQQTLTHEQAHNTQHNLGSDHSFSSNYGPRLAWSIENVGLNQVQKIKTKDGNYYEYVGQPGMHNVWKLANKDRPWYQKTLTAKLFTKAPPGELSSYELREKLEVKPITYYYKNVLEETAEALMLFRGGKLERRRLLEESPKLYDCAKEIDQAEIKKIYGLNENKQAKYIRDFDGSLIENSKQNQKSIKALESKL